MVTTPYVTKQLRYLLIPLVALGYFLSAKVGLLLAFDHSSVSPVWPPTGLAIGLALLWGPATLPGVWLGAFLSNFCLTPVGFPVAAGIAVGNTLEAATALLLVRRFIPDVLYFDRVKSVLSFVLLAGCMSTSLAAVVGAVTLCLGGAATWEQFPVLFQTWWVGDAGGALIVAPLIIGFPTFLKHHWKFSEFLEFTFLILAVFFTTEASFGKTHYLEYFRTELPLGFLNIPIFIWAAYRFKQIGITFLLAIQAVITIKGTVSGGGPFWRQNPNDSLIIVQLFLLSRAIAFHFLACVIAELRQFRFISDNALESHYLIDDTGRILYVNNVAAKRLGYSKAELNKIRIETVCPMVQPSYIDKVLKSPPGAQFEAATEVRHIRKDGSSYPAEATIIPISTNGRSRAFYVGRDISLRKEVETELSRKADQLSKLNSELETFTSMVSHDLKSPLRNISNLIQLIHEKFKTKLDSEDTKLFDLIFESCSRMNRLIKDLLTSAQIGRHAAAAEKVEMMGVLSSVLKGLDSQMKDVAAKVTTDSLPALFGRKTELEVVIQNLLVNAMKYRSSKPPKIHIGVKSEEAQWVFSVTDNGIGFPEEAKEKIFRPFVRIRTETQREGTGLGLAMCRKVVEGMGGKIWCESVVGKGTTFFFSLPKEEAPIPFQVPVMVSAPDVSSTTVPQVPPRILIIDDSPTDSNVLEVLLKKESESAHIVVAKDGEKALSYLQRTPAWALPSLILLDVTLPRIDGFAVLKELKANESLKSIPVIMLTTSEDPEEVKRAYSNSAACYLKKPHDLNGYRRMVSLVQQFWFDCARLPSPPLVPQSV